MKAEAVQLGSRTYLKVEETYSGDRMAPVFEYLDLEAPVNTEGFHIDLKAGLWLKADPLGND
ncbi:MAG: hypothetical protein D6778_04745, partial [Nitrospirae bacterium]